MTPNNRFCIQISGALLATLAILLVQSQSAEAAQGCPFENESCQEYCNQQGCNLGYCGHFAWIQCICRKCGDEWNSYDKIRYKPDEKVNQTELDSLNLNSTGPIILTNSTNNTNSVAKPIELGQSAEESEQTQKATTASATTSTSTQTDQQQQPQNQNLQQQQQPINKQQATLTTLLIPDLSEPNDKIDPNEVPDENSEKFLDYLAQNHDRLAQASRAGKDQNQEESSSDQQSQEPAQSSSDDSGASKQTSDDETVEIQINSGSINSSNGKPTNQQTTTTTVHEKSPLETTSNAGLMKLVKLAVEQRPNEDIN